MKTLFDTPVTINNLGSISYNEMLRSLEPLLMESVPEGTLGDPDVMKRLDFLLARLANVHAYLSYLWAYASSETNRLKLAGLSDHHTLMQKKKETLYQFCSAIKLKWQAVSRIITLHIEEDDENTPDRVDYEAREEKKTARKSPKPAAAPSTGWDII